jgi:putative PIN family toxin of toxin-antitoxin system
MRVVIDTNVIISGFLWYGLPRRIIDLAVERKISVFVSLEILIELERVLGYPYILKRLRRIERTGQDIIKEFKEYAEIVSPVPGSSVLVPKDPDDDAILRAALSAKAQYIITGDDHLQTLISFCSISIVSPTEFIAMYDSR